MSSRDTEKRGHPCAIKVRESGTWAGAKQCGRRAGTGGGKIDKKEKERAKEAQTRVHERRVHEGEDEDEDVGRRSRQCTGGWGCRLRVLKRQPKGVRGFTKFEDAQIRLEREVDVTTRFERVRRRESEDRACRYIPQNCFESWEILRATLAHLEERGVDPHSAILNVLHSERIREEASGLNKSLVAHLTPHLGTNYVPTVNDLKALEQYCAHGTDKIAKETFMACLPTRHAAIMHASSAPLLLGRVCAAWRAISLSTARLWSSVHVVLPIIASDPAAVPSLEGLRIWLRCSGDCPLSIAIFVPLGCPNDCWLACVDIILPHHRRWRTLMLLGATRELPASCDLIAEDLPLLETVVVSNNVTEAPNFRTVQFLSVPPNLRYFAINNAHDQVLDLVALCVNLTTCRLAFPVRPPDGLPPTAPRSQTTLPNLEVLTMTGDITVDSAFNVVQILDALALPALQQLCLHGLSMRDPHAEPPPLSDMLLALDELTNRSSCDLLELAWRCPFGDTAALLQCLHRSHLLTRLTLIPKLFIGRDPLDLTPVLSELANTSSPHPLCPNLRHLRIAYCDLTEAIHPILQTLIVSRCSSAPPAIARLRTAHLRLLHRMAGNTTEFAAATHPCEVTIVEPPRDLHKVKTSASWGIYDEDMFELLPGKANVYWLQYPEPTVVMLEKESSRSYRELCTNLPGHQPYFTDVRGIFITPFIPDIKLQDTLGHRRAKIPVVAPCQMAI
ncbi:hypothetical protein DFH06DRAFT_1299486 [Mycena polygramma]|nr:hypothetical protein DFH06DRAFT_1299486 [Mycena polygramma]